MKNLIIVSAGGFARELLFWLEDSHCNEACEIKGFLSPNPKDLDGFDIDLPILGDEQSYEIQPDDRFLVPIGDISLRKKVVETLVSKGAKFVTVRHSTAIIADNAIMGQGVIIGPHSVISTHTQIGDFSLINSFASCSHDSRLGAYSYMCPYSTLNGFAQMGHSSFMGTRASVGPGIKVGDNTILSAHSMVLENKGSDLRLKGTPAN